MVSLYKHCLSENTCGPTNTFKFSFYYYSMWGGTEITLFFKMSLFINSFHFVMTYPSLLLNVGGLATGVCQLHSQGQLMALWGTEGTIRPYS